MAILNDVEIWFAKVNPNRPNSKFNKKNPTWECQIRTNDKSKKKQWEALNLNVKAVIPDNDVPFFRVNLRKKSIKEDGSEASFVKVIDGNLDPVDPDSIGNGSIANVRIFQYEYQKEGGGTGTASVLMGIQLTRHIIYVPKARDDDFTETTTEIIDNTDDTAEDFSVSKAPSPSPVIVRPESDF